MVPSLRSSDQSRMASAGTNTMNPTGRKPKKARSEAWPMASRFVSVYQVVNRKNASRMT